MQRLKLWQAIVLVVVAVGIAVSVIWRSSTIDPKGAPIPPAFTGGASPMAPKK
jgi:hypothetical protein